MRRVAAVFIVGVAVGVAVGVLVARTGAFVQIVTVLVEGFITVLDRHGLAVALAVAGFVFLGWLVWRCMTWVIEGRDREINRLVDEKKWWQERYAGTVPSSSQANEQG